MTSDQPPSPGDTHPSAQQRSTPIGIDEIETYLCCPRRHQYAHRQSIATQAGGAAADRRSQLYRSILTAALKRASEADTSLSEAATDAVDDAIGEATHSTGRYDAATIRNAVTTYADDHAAHATGAIAIDETARYRTGGYTIDCPVDCYWREGNQYEIARFVTTLDGIVWENPYSDPIAGYRDGEEFYPREVGSILRAYATIHAVADATDIDPHRIRYRYYAIAAETYPTDRDAAGGAFDPTVITESRDVTDTCWDGGEACETVIADTAASIAAEHWDPTGDRWAEIQRRSCRDCAYQSMCLDAINEAVRF